MGHLIRNLVSFKLGWVACVVFAAAGKPVLAALSVAAVALLHLLQVANPRKELLFLLAAAGIGLLWETFMVWTGLVQYPGYASSSVLAPYWIVAMWVLFATTVNHGLRWVKRSPWVAAVAGLLGGPMAFFGGMNLGAVEFSSTPAALAVIGLGWAVLLPALVLIADTIIDSSLFEQAPAERREVRPARTLEVGYE